MDVTAAQKLLQEQALQVVQDLMGTKPWWQSKAIFGASIAILSGLAGLAGIVIAPEDQQTLANLLFALGPIIGGIIAWIGRVKATNPIGKPNP